MRVSPSSGTTMWKPFDPDVLIHEGHGDAERRPVIIQVALNGTRTRVEHAAIPITPAEQATEARASVAAGASAIHVHVRDEHGNESLAAPDVAKTIEAIRTACPDVPIGIGREPGSFPTFGTACRSSARGRCFPISRR